ncbi:hypothetical protein EVG20_g8519 [Dentipellis fragilis]|uniref:Uncharacterized protein n=1 Tax=Dentipellis fragilis TaxID=205917 RepID=A0A4Y9Y7V5_9AGAM|nr:hypothetical protein EVG20_g8519 [Dentipellis fragilis]
MAPERTPRISQPGAPGPNHPYHQIPASHAPPQTPSSESLNDPLFFQDDISPFVQPSEQASAVMASFMGNTVNQGSQRHSPSAPLIDAMANDLQMSHPSRTLAHQASVAGISAQMNTVMCHVLAATEYLVKIEAGMKEQKAEIEELRRVVISGWNLTDAHKASDILTPLYAAVNNYCDGTVTQCVLKYIKKNADHFDLPDYAESDIQQKVVDTYVRTYAHTARSNNRKAVCFSIEKNEPLEVFVTKMVKRNYYQYKGGAIAESVLAQFALMRVTAKPLMAISRKKGADFGLWPAVDETLRMLQTKLGPGRKTPGWDAWYKQIIEADKAQFTVAVGTTVTLNEESEDDGLYATDATAAPVGGEGDNE